MKSESPQRAGRVLRRKAVFGVGEFSLRDPGEAGYYKAAYNIGNDSKNYAGRICKNRQVHMYR